jgi:ribosome-binding factor A
LKSDRITRINELLKREIAESLYRVLADTEVDLSAVTITHVTCARDLREAIVGVSIRGSETERSSVLAHLRRHRAEIQGCINRDLSLKYTPRLSFELDRSLEKGDHVLNLLLNMERQEEARPKDEAQAAGPEPLAGEAKRENAP